MTSWIWMIMVKDKISSGNAATPIVVSDTRTPAEGRVLSAMSGWTVNDEFRRREEKVT